MSDMPDFLHCDIKRPTDLSPLLIYLVLTLDPVQARGLATVNGSHALFVNRCADACSTPDVLAA
jgi:hypothetical protein